MATIANLATAMGMPQGAIVHYVLAKWASNGSAGLLEIGPSMVKRLYSVIEQVDDQSEDAAKLKAYDQLSKMISWLAHPILHDGNDRS